MVNTFVLIVTYGDHEAQLKTVLNKTLQNSRINHVFVVDNGSTYSLVDRIEDIKSERVTLISLNQNTGSAGGFGRGIRAVVKYSMNDTDRLVILDDDSYIEGDALDKIEQYEQQTTTFGQQVWSLNRLQLHETVQPFGELFDYNNAYHYNSVYRFSMINKFFPSRFKVSRKSHNIRKLSFAPYSGLVLNVATIKKIGYPQEEMFLYSDDIEYTFRISESGINILQMYNANIRDIAGSWFNSKTINVHRAYFQGTENNFRALYTYRNEAYLAETIFKKNSLIYNINYFFWLLNIMIKHMPKTKKGWRQFKKIIVVSRQGRKKELGQFEKQFLN